MASLEYIAGFLDGEGSIQISKGATHRTGKRIFYLRISVHQVDRRPLDELVERWGGSLRLIEKASRLSKRPIWEWVVSGTTAAKVLSDVRPFLIGKADQAEVALMFQSRKRLRGSGNDSATSGIELAEQEILYQRMRDLKKN